MLTDLPYEPTVYVTAGTTYNTWAATMFQTIIEALGNEHVNVVVTVGPTGDATAFGSLPAHIRVETFVPQNVILPYCDAVICHAGAASALGALVHSLPLLMFPIASDHHEVAAQIVEVGAGQALAQDELNVVNVRKAATELLSNPDYRRQAVRLRNQILSMPAPVEVATRLTGLPLDRHEL